MSKTLRSSAFPNSSPNVSGLVWNHYTCTLEETDDFPDIFAASWWKHHVSEGANGRLHEGDIVRLIAADRSFDVNVTIDKIQPGGADVSFYYGRLPEAYAGLDAYELRRRFTKDESEFDIVKLDREGKPYARVEYLPASKWRVVGNDKDVIAEGIPSKMEADKRMSKYLYDMNLRMPAPAEQEKYVRDLLAKEAEQAKVIARKSAKSAA